MKKKLRIGILFGGRSGEHEVSLLSAASILKAIDRKKYEVVPIGITKQGQWVTSGEAQHLLTGESKPAPVLQKKATSQSIQLSASADLAQQTGPLTQQLDVIFPRPPRHLRRRRHHPGPLRTSRHSLRRLRRPRLRHRHGQGRHEAALRRRQPPADPARSPHPQRMEGRRQTLHPPHRKNSHLPGLRKTRESRLFRTDGIQSRTESRLL